MKGEISKGFASLPGLSTQAKYLMSLTLLVGISVDVSKSKQPKPTNRPTRSSNNTLILTGRTLTRHITDIRI